MSEFPCLINEYFSVYLKHVCYQSCLIMTAIIIPDTSYLYLHLSVVGFYVLLLIALSFVGFVDQWDGIIPDHYLHAFIIKSEKGFLVRVHMQDI